MKDLEQELGQEVRSVIVQNSNLFYLHKEKIVC
jgi:hypothetical protein